MSQLQLKNAVVLGVSTDTVDSHKRFAEKEHLNFPLLADTEKQMSAAYGVLGANGFSNRVTFVIGEDGKIRQIDRAVNAQFAREGNTLTTRHGTNLALLLSDWRAHTGQPVPNFSLPDVDGKTVSLLRTGKKASVVLFLGIRSPASHTYAERLRRLASDPAYQQVAFLGLYPNVNETPATIKAEAERDQLGFPVAKDENNEIADHFGATLTPYVWVVNAKGVAVYTGAIDDNLNPTRVTAPYLKAALDATLADKPVAPAETRAIGDTIRRAHKKKRH
jgi:peroxiredoxin